jgi:sensor histidine kinase YesM
MSKRIFYYILICFLVAAVVHFINSYYTAWDPSFFLDPKQYTINFVYALIIGLANIVFFGTINRYFSWEKHPKKMLFAGILGSVIVSTLGFYLARVVHFTLILGYSYNAYLQLESKASYIFSIFIAFIITLFYHLIYFYKALEDSKRKELELLRLQQEKEIDFLKQQLDPHFLFNNLNVLSSLIEENPLKAEAFTQELAKVYRYVIKHQKEHLVSLKDELDFAKNYLQLMAKRFEDGFTFSIQIKEDTSQLILVPLSLQVLLENIFKHNKINYKTPLTIEIFTKNNYLVVYNEGERKQGTNEMNTGIGLQNIQQQYLQLVGKAIIIEAENNSFSVQLPLLEISE